MNYKYAFNRMQILQRILSKKRISKEDIIYIPTRLSSDSGQVTIGGISKAIKIPKTPPYVPVHYLDLNAPQSWLRHLKWMLQKDHLGQDIFLIGPPGPLRRHLALSYVELTKREVELITLTRDTTDSDLKQRREIFKGTSFYHDQSAVRAALEGRVLILEGIEKAERNVLPVLNNLLENREMQLEDGRLLIPAARYDKLLQESSKEDLDRMRLARVSEDFRVIALGLPSPPYLGHPLDPPLRSRFQARNVSGLPFKEQLRELSEAFPNVSSDVITRSLSLAHTLSSEESKGLSLPDFPLDNLHRVLAILEKQPSALPEKLLQRLYPAKAFLSPEGHKSALEAFKSFDLAPPEYETDAIKGRNSITGVKSGDKEGLGVATLNVEGHQISAEIMTGDSFTGTPPPYIMTPYHDEFVSELLQSHSIGDFCIIGPRGCGKSAAVSKLAHLLGYQTEPILLYQDMTARDLVQQRITTPEGDTSWQLAPLVLAALEGKMAILDGIHRLHHGTLAVLHRLLHDRELQLYDGTRLLRHDRYDVIKEENNLSDSDMANLNILRIHPSFRVAGISEPPQIGATKGQWLTPESLTLFLYHNMRPLSHKETVDLVQNLLGGSVPAVSELIRLSGTFSASTDPALRSLSQSLSLRQIIRIAKRFQAYPNFDLHTAVYKACLARFLPALAKQALDTMLVDAGILKADIPLQSEIAKCEVKDGVLKIGNTQVPLYQTESASKVPDTLFYDIKQHVRVLEDMLQDWLLGDHLLLIGNQGVGKNKLADRFLYLMNRPREYIQLHRDTTVQSLTIQPTVLEGRIQYEDSPLVTAVKTGRVLMVDEADKAPTHVTCVLKSLIECGEMLLSDGRRIIPQTHPLATSGSHNIIVAHPDFRMIFLANRPGFPFLGNDFFAALGDLFSCHAIDNPSAESEMELLKSYGPDVAEHQMRQLVDAFGELRDMADQGLIQYPYSTREVVQIVKHLQKYGDDGLASVVRNVFDFDSWAGEAKKTVIKIMHKHGIPVGASASNVSLSKKMPLPQPIVASSWQVRRQQSGAKDQLLQLPISVSSLQFQRKVKVHLKKDLLAPSESRSAIFTEQQSFWTIPIYETALVTGLATQAADNKADDLVHITTVAPYALYTLNPKLGPSPISSLLLHDIIPSMRGLARPRLSIATLPNGLLAIHEEVLNSLVLVDPEYEEVYPVRMNSAVKNVTQSIMNSFSKNTSPESFYRMNKDRSHEGFLLFWEYGGGSMLLLDTEARKLSCVTVPMTLKFVSQLSAKDWFIEDQDGKKWLLRGGDEFNCPCIIEPIDENHSPLFKTSDNISATSFSEPLKDFVLSTSLGQKLSAPSRLFSPVSDMAAIAVGFPDFDSSPNEIHLWPREGAAPDHSPADMDPSTTVALLPEAGQVIRVLGKLPHDARHVFNPVPNASYLEVVDLVNHSLSYVPVHHKPNSPMWNFLARGRGSSVMVSPLGKEAVVSVDATGGMRIWETGSIRLQEALAEWKKMIGQDEKHLRLEVEKKSGKDVTGPKHGKIDPKGAPHVGGNTWAGGTGGRDTAGLGGKGGPYRLDAGHDITQLPEDEIAAVPEEVRKAAREMARKAFEDRLREIQMSEYDANLYEKLITEVRPQIRSLRNIISSLQAKNKERQWRRHRTEGDIDDTKLIEGLAGERTIYRQRREEEPEIGAPQTKPKRLRIAVDVSGSMYRFNGHDGRLERELEACLMVMEAFEGFENKFKYEIYGHSGDEPDSPLVRADSVPKDNKERLDVLKTMQAHSQFCLSGDHTLEAAKVAISDLAKSEDSDESFVILLSDANIERYGIRPSNLATILTSEPSVHSYAIFIGSLGDQADRITQALPAGRAFVCMDLSKLPQILQQIFTSAMLT